MDKREELLKLVIDHPELYDFLIDAALAMLVRQDQRQKVEKKSS